MWLAPRRFTPGSPTARRAAAPPPEKREGPDAERGALGLTAGEDGLGCLLLAVALALLAGAVLALRALAALLLLRRGEGRLLLLAVALALLADAVLAFRALAALRLTLGLLLGVD